MKLTKRTLYALQALVDIANHKTEHPAKLKEISDRLGMSGKFLEQILRTLIVKGILSSRRGPAGGYFLQKPAGEVCVHDVLVATEGPVRLVPCVGTPDFAQEECPLLQRCPANSAWEDIHRHIVELFRSWTLQDLCDGVLRHTPHTPSHQREAGL